LYQQNTMRDAMVAALTLNIFNQHSDRVVMANIAQMVNVLQAVILTEGDKMVLTPTYHVFDLYKHHHDATLLGSYVETAEIGTEEDKVQNLTVSASVDADGVIHVTAANLSATEACPVELALTGKCGGKATGRILTGSTADFNDFDHPETVTLRAMEGITEENGTYTFTMPACSVVELTIE
ncbi:MAG: alpha-N-arabinofuranosidase, partial [Clostridia bacterium]|nr:alpha-N-arabinofuranosidase [Clostridia bacterium]